MGLEVEGISKRYGAAVALDGISLSARAGRVFGFLGPNGAGKTTTMRIVLGMLCADAGTVTWAGRPAREAVASTWGYLPEERGLYPRMGVLAQLVYLARLHGVPGDEAVRRARRWLARFRIADAAERRAEELSKGNQQKVQFIGTVLHEPEVLLLDEPFSGLDPVNASMLKEAFLEQRDAGRTIVFSTHQMEAVEELCDDVAIIDHGRLVLSGPLAQVKRQAGRTVVRLAVDGDRDPCWLDAMPHETIRRAGLEYHELPVRDGQDPESILYQAIARGWRVTRFEIAEPSIEDIFIERVGAGSTAERRLATEADQ